MREARPPPASERCARGGAILDEQLSPQTAALLRKAGYDVDAVAVRADLTVRGDRVIFEVATREGRAVVQTTSRTSARLRLSG